MEIKDRILIVEDDPSISNLLTAILKANSYQTMTAKSGTEAETLLASWCPDMVILDLGLPDIDGVAILKNLRTWSSMPVLVVSARTHERDKVEALDLGADDYITKPFGSSELLARIRTALRHHRAVPSGDAGSQSGIFRTGALTIDYNKHRVYVNGNDANLTLNEFRILAFLGKYAGRVITYDAIIREIWGPNMKNDNRILRVNMANIRRKIEEDPAQPRYIFTEIGVGYRMADGDTSV